MPGATPRLVLLLVLLVVGGQMLRTQLGVAPTVDAVREWADALGWRAPAAFLGLVIVRQVILLPAVVLLTAGGLIFGGLVGTALGGTGLIVSGLGNFLIARRLGAATVPPSWRAKLLRLTARGPAPVLIFTGLATMHPVGPLLAAHWAAGCSAIAVTTFAMVIVPASYARAAALATFGSTLADWGSPASLALAAAFVAAVVIPLSIPAVRRRVFDPAPPIPGDA